METCDPVHHDKRVIPTDADIQFRQCYTEPVNEAIVFTLKTGL